MHKITKRIFFWTATALFIAISVFVVIQGAEPVINTDIEIDKISESDWTQGNPDAEVKVIIYSDFQCPACSMYASLVEEMMKEFKNHVHLAYRHFPLVSIHPHSPLAARAANAAGKQGKFFEMHDLLFLNKEYWEKSNPQEVEEGFKLFAQNLELDIDQFIKDYNSEENIKSVENARNVALEAGLTYTPTFIINGEIIKMPRDQEEFNKVIRDAIEATK